MTGALADEVRAHGGRRVRRLAAAAGDEAASDAEAAALALDQALGEWAGGRTPEPVWYPAGSTPESWPTSAPSRRGHTREQPS